MNDTSNKPAASTRKPLLILFLVFVGPLLLAMAMYFGQAYLPAPHSVAKGQLIKPARPVESFQATQTDGGEVTKDYLLHTWHLVLVSDGECDLECEATMFKMRQARLLTSKDIHRVNLTVMLNSEASPSEHFVRVKERFTKIEQIGLKDIEFQEVGVEAMSLQPGVLYMVDPLGNFMMIYDHQVTTKGLLKDLKKVLKISKVG